MTDTHIPKTPKVEPSPHALPHSDPYKEIVDRSHAEIQWVRSAYTLAISLVSFVIVVGLYFSYHSAKDFKDELRAEGKTVHDRLTDEISSHSARLEGELESKFKSLSTEVSERVDRELGSKEIQLLVKTKVQERIDQKADEIIAREIESKVTPIQQAVEKRTSDVEAHLQATRDQLEEQIDTIETKRVALDKALEDTRAALKTLNQQSEFIMTENSAANDNRAAYIRLEKWANDEAYPFNIEAREAIHVIAGEYAGFEKPFVSTPFNTNVSFDGWTLETLQQIVRTAEPMRLPGVMKSIWETTNIPKNMRAELLIDVMQGTGNSLQAANKAGRLLAEELGKDLNPPFEFTPIIDAWRARTNDAGTSQGVK